MTAKEDFSRRVWRTALLAVGLLRLAHLRGHRAGRRNWVPGAIIVVASLIGLARQIPIIARLCSEAAPSSRHRTPTG